MFNGKLTILGSVTSRSVASLLFIVFVGCLRFAHNGLWWTNLNEYTLDMTNISIKFYTSSIALVFVCLLNICVALGFFMTSVRTVEILQSSFTLPLSHWFFHVC